MQFYVGSNIMTSNTCACCVKNEILIYPTYKHDIMCI